MFREEETKFVEELTQLLEEGIRKEMGLGGDVFVEEVGCGGGSGGGVGLEGERWTALEICGTEGGCAGLGT